MQLKSRHLLGTEALTPEEITLILDTAESFAEISQREIKKVPTLRGQTVINLFMEPSTRTRTSFELAEKRLSADSLNFAASTSSVVKGETLAKDDKGNEMLGLLIFENGMPTKYKEADATAVVKEETIYVTLDCGVGNGRAIVWTCDLSHDYVDINGSYRS